MSRMYLTTKTEIFTFGLENKKYVLYNGSTYRIGVRINALFLLTTLQQCSLRKKLQNRWSNASYPLLFSFGDYVIRASEC